MTKSPILDSSGNKVVVNEGESAFITATFYDTSGDVLNKSAIETLVCTLRDAGGDIINSRDEQSILDANGGTVSSSGVLTLKLGPDDNTVAGGFIETHSILVKWTWTDGDAETQTGIHEWSLDVAPSISSATALGWLG